jgi:aminoglycoside phosphotransferase (APT) family kinase protein
MESSTIADLMRSLLVALREDIKGELSSPQARHRADLVDMMLVRLATEMEHSVGDNDRYPQGVSSAEVSALCDKSIDPARFDELNKIISSFVAVESNRRNAIENRVEQIATTSAPGGHSGSELSIPKETFTQYLKSKFPEDPAIEVSAVSVIPGGRSKGTILLDVLDAAGSRSIVIRRDFAAMVTGVSVIYEYPIIRALWKSGIEVPQPLWLEEDISVIGAAFIAFSRVPGQAMGTLFQSDASPVFARAFASALARVHSVDIQDTGLADYLNWGRERIPVRAMVDSFYKRYREKVTSTPILDTAFAWLYLQMDTIGTECSLVHGDASLHNTLGEGDRLTGLLDWEFAHAGDPAEDLCYCKQLIETILPWPEFMEAYRNSGGGDISEARMQFFTVWRSVMLAVQMGGAKAMYESGVDRDLRIAATGFNSLPKILNQLAIDLARFTSR